MEYIYKPRSVCARQITVELDGETIKKVTFIGACSGNTSGISRLVEGRNAKEVIETLRGTRCGSSMTSCPDQLSWAIEGALNAE